MSTDIERASDLTIAHDQTRFTDVQIETLLRHMGVKNAPRADIDVFFHRCKTTGLDPFSGQIHMIGRNTRQPDGTYVETFTIQTGIDGYRLTARRAANRARHQMSISSPEWCDENGTWRPVWSHRRWGYPLAARVTVTRDGQAYTAVANFDEYVQTRAGGQPNRMWATMPAGQIGKCAEALALRKAFPQDLSDLYVAEEMEQADNAAPVPNPRPELNEARPRLDVSAPVEGVVIAPEGAPPPSAPDTTRTDSLAELFQLMAEAGPSGKAAKIEYMSRVIGREIGGSGDLTDDEITAVMDALHVDRAAAAEDADSSSEDQ